MTRHKHGFTDARTAVEAKNLALGHVGADNVEDLGVDVAQDGFAVEGHGDVIQGEDGVAVGVGGHDVARTFSPRVSGLKKNLAVVQGRGLKVRATL